MFKTIIVGRGLFGAAAARHLATMQDGVAVVGPDEPADRQAHRGVFASHYDEGRMSRINDPVWEWSITATRSIARYATIEAESGIKVFTPAGYAGFGPSGTPAMAEAERIGRANGADCARIDAGAARRRFSCLAFPDGNEVLVETGSAGYISPRAMVEAASKIAEARGATLIREAAARVRAAPGGVEVETDGGALHRAEKVLVATGGFTGACGLSPRPLATTVYGRTVALFRIPAALASEFAGMPTLGDFSSGAYILPPILYPDGQLYLKIGLGRPVDPRMTTRQDLTRWFKSPGSAENREEFVRYLTALIPALNDCPDRHTDSCVVTATASGLPYIDFVHDDRIAVAVGGNGKGAKSGDDWGYAAARLMAGGEWDHPVPREKLAARFAA